MWETSLIFWLSISLTWWPISDWSASRVFEFAYSPEEYVYQEMRDGQRPAPLVLDQIKDLVRIEAPDLVIAKEIRNRGVNFPATTEVLNELRKLGAGSQTLGILSSFILNHPPTVAFNVDHVNIKQGDSIILFANASDPDNDEIDYYWASSKGVIQANGTSAKLETSEFASSENAYQITITLTVSDRKGGNESYSKSLNVSPNLSTQGLRGSELDHHEKASLELPAEQKVWVDGKYTMVQIQGSANDSRPWGYIEITLRNNGTSVTLESVTGEFPGLPCRADFITRENVAELSFKEPPSTFNRWKGATMRIRSKSTSRITRFGIYWQVLQELVK